MRRLLMTLVTLLPFPALAQPTNPDLKQVYNAVVYEGNLTVDQLKTLNGKLDAILDALKSQAAPPVTASTTPPVTTPPVTAGGVPAAIGRADGTTLTLAKGIEPADALAFMKPGWTMVVQPGRFVKTFAVAYPLDNITIKCATDAACILDGQGGNGEGHRLTWGKACILVTDSSFTLNGFAVRHCGSPASGNSFSNESGIYADLGSTNLANVPNVVITIERNLFDGNANPLFGANAVGGKFIVRNNVFGFKEPNGLNGYANGTASGPAHDMYLQLGPQGQVEVAGNYFYGNVGHNVKTRAGHTNIHDNPLMTYGGGRVADLSEGGDLQFTNNHIWYRSGMQDALFPPQAYPSGYPVAWTPKGGLFGNSNMLATGDENTNAGIPTGAITGNTFEISRTNSTLWVSAGGVLTASGNSVKYYGSGSLTVSGVVTGDLTPGAAIPGQSPASAPPPPAPPSWASWQ